MKISELDIISLRPREKRYRISIGNSLFIEVYPKGGKYFCWSYRFPPSRHGQQRWYQIGPYGQGLGCWSLEEAKNERNRLDSLRKLGNDPRKLKVKSKSQITIKNLSLFNTISNKWLDNIFLKFPLIKFKDYKKKLNNEILPIFGNHPINSITREECIRFKRNLESNTSYNYSKDVIQVLKKILSFAVESKLLGPESELLISKKNKLVFQFNYDLELSPKSLIFEDKQLKFIPVKYNNKTHINLLFKLICSMKYPISNNIQPSIKEHKEFVRKHPYRSWLLIEINKYIIGNIYLGFNNSIGINLLKEDYDIYKDCLLNLLKVYKPLPPKKSIRSKSFFINFNPSNITLEKALIDTGMIYIQKTYLLK